MVEYVTIHGKKYPVRLGYYVMKRVKAETGKSLGEALKDSADNPEVHEIILYAALQVGAFAEDQQLDLTPKDMPMALDLCFNDYMNMFTSEAFFPKELVDRIQGNLGKEQPVTPQTIPVEPKKKKTKPRKSKT